MSYAVIPSPIRFAQGRLFACHPFPLVRASSEPFACHPFPLVRASSEPFICHSDPAKREKDPFHLTQGKLREGSRPECAAFWPCIAGQRGV